MADQKRSNDDSSGNDLPAAELAATDDLPRVVPGNADLGEVQILGEQLVWENKAIRLFNDRVRYPARDGGKHVEADAFRLTDAPGKVNGVIIVPITSDDRIILVRQFRHPVRMWMLELPRGARDAGESPEDAAGRELHEETGHAVDSFHSLGRVAPDSGQLSSVPYVIAARVHPAGPPDREKTETIDRTVAMPYPVLRAACERGEILDGYTLAGVLRLGPYVSADGRIRLGNELGNGSRHDSGK